MRKLFIASLVAAMCLGFAATAFAASAINPPAFSDIAGHEAEAELTLLAAMGVYSGESGIGGAVKPDDPITRAQFCKVLVLALGRGSTAAGLAGLQPNYKDGATIPTWAWGYVNVASYMNVIKGYADGTFGPNNPVTYAEAVTMLIRAVSGHEAMVGAGTWPYNYIFYGVDNGFTGTVDVGFANLPATRGDMAKLLVATMQINKLNSKGEEILDSAILTDRVYEEGGSGYHAGRLYEGVALAYDGDSLQISEGGYIFDVELAEKVYVVGAASFLALENMPVFAVLNTDGDIMFVAVTGESEAITGVFDELGDADDDGNPDQIVLADGRKIPFTEGGTVNTNINEQTGLDQTQLEPGDELTITTGSDGKAANIVAVRFNEVDFLTHFAASDDDNDTHIETNGGSAYDVPKGCVVTLNGNASDRDKLAVNDAVLIAESWVTSEPIVIRAHREVVEGTVAGTITSYPGPVYRVTIDLKTGGSKTYVLNEDGGILLPDKGDVVKYGLDFDGKIYVPIGYETQTPYVVVKGYEEYSDGTAKVTVDVRGTLTTYKTTVDFSGEIGEYGEIELDTATNTVTDFTPYTIDATEYTVLSLDVAKKTMTLKAGTTIYFVDNKDAVVYKVTSSGKVYIGIEGLKVGDKVKADATPDSAVFFELVTP